MTDYTSLLPALRDDEFQALKADIAERGCLVAVELDEDGQVLDGANRLRACSELGIKPPTITRRGLNEPEKRAHAIALNLKRRQLSQEQTRGLVAEMVKAAPEKSDRQHAEAAGVSHVTVGGVRKGLEATGQIDRLAVRVGADNKARALPRPAPVLDFPEAVTRSEYEKADAPQTTAERIVASNENEWYTPAKYLIAARKVLGPIDLDPASSVTANQVVAAKEIFTEADGSLERDWHGRVWVNPPYGRLAGDFIDHLVQQYHAGNVRTAIALVNAHSTDTRWFQSLWHYPLCFTDHRIDFDSAGRDKTSTSTHGSVFAYLGSSPATFASKFSEFGTVVSRWSA